MFATVVKLMLLRWARHDGKVSCPVHALRNRETTVTLILKTVQFLKANDKVETQIGGYVCCSCRINVVTLGMA